MFEFIQKFCRQENGAVTVDFVVVAAALVGLGIAVSATVADGTLDTAAAVNANMEADVPTQSFAAAID